MTGEKWMHVDVIHDNQCRRFAAYVGGIMQLKELVISADSDLANGQWLAGMILDSAPSYASDQSGLYERPQRSE